MKKMIIASILTMILSAGICARAENTNLYFSAFDEKIIWNKLELSSEQLDLFKQGSMLVCEAITTEKFTELGGEAVQEWSQEYQGLDIGAKATISMIYVEDTSSYGVHTEIALPDSKKSHVGIYVEDLIGAYLDNTSEIGDYDNSLSVMAVGEKHFSIIAENNHIKPDPIHILSSDEFFELNARPELRVDKGFFCTMFNLFDM